ncbi:hypothetical protein V6N13_040631 [Hibiscus sabdariffa]
MVSRAVNDSLEKLESMGQAIDDIGVSVWESTAQMISHDTNCLYLESMGQAIDDIGVSVWESTAQMISHGKDSFLSPSDDDNPDPENSTNNSINIFFNLQYLVEFFFSFLESVGQAIDDIGVSVWESTAQMISHGEMTTTGTTNFKERWRLSRHGLNWSDLPLDILERVIGRLRWVDRIQIQAVCKAWSVPSTHVPAIDELPWAMKFRWHVASSSLIQGECRLLDPLFREYLVDQRSRGIDYQFFQSAIPSASSYGWVLFIVDFFYFDEKQEHLFLYSPFTTEFDGFHGRNHAVDAAYTNGVFYCVFEGGQLGAFNVELKGWTVLVDHCPLSEYSLPHAKLIVSGADLQLLSDSSSLELLKLDFTKMDWVYENDLNNRVLFIGYTSFSVPAVGETSVLANTIFAARGSFMHPRVRFYGSTSPTQSRLYRKCIEAASCTWSWIELPSCGIWRADDLIHAV